MNIAQTLFAWQYLVFEIPLLVAALFLVLTALRPHGNHSHVHVHAGHVGGPSHRAGHPGMHAVTGSAAGHTAPTAVHAAPAVATPTTAAVAGHTATDPAPTAHAALNGLRHPMSRANAATHAAAGHGPSGHASVPRNAVAVSRNLVPLPDARHGVSSVLLSVIGARTAPLPLVIETGFLGWGVFGMWANSVFVHAASPNALQVLPSAAVAAVGGFATMRVAGKLGERMMPKDETLVVSRDALFGLVGEVVYTVTASGGRVHVYDQFGTMHDELCRVSSGAPEIARGAWVMVADFDAQGHMIVEEAAAPAAVQEELARKDAHVEL